MASPTKDTLFAAARIPAKDKAEHTSNAARAIISAESNARESKTDRLRKARMAQEAIEQAAVAAAPPPPEKKPKRAPRKAKA